MSQRCSIQPVGKQILSGLNIAGHTWNLWTGPNANWQVFSFVISSGEVRNFNADLNAFFRASLLAPSARVHSVLSPSRRIPHREPRRRVLPGQRSPTSSSICTSADAASATPRCSTSKRSKRAQNPSSAPRASSPRASASRSMSERKNACCGAPAGVAARARCCPCNVRRAGRSTSARLDGACVRIRDYQMLCTLFVRKLVPPPSKLRARAPCPRCGYSGMR